MLRQRWGGIENLFKVALVRIRSQILVLTPPWEKFVHKVVSTLIGTIYPAGEVVKFILHYVEFILREL